MLEEFEDNKGVIRIHNSKKDKQHNDQTKNNKRINNDLQNITHKSKKDKQHNDQKTNNKRTNNDLQSIHIE